MSKIQLSPYVNFQGRAREAMEFYHGILGGTLELRASDERGASKPAGPGDRITQARLEVDGALILASDGHPDYPAKVGDDIAIALHGADKNRLTRVFNGLAEGGRIQMPLSPQPWGAEAGWLKDRYGMSWTISIDRP